MNYIWCCLIWEWFYGLLCLICLSKTVTLLFMIWPIIAGLSLKSQELTAIFLAVRLYCSFVMEYDIHTLLDTATLATTLWVIYMIRFRLKSTYMEEKDNFAIYFVVSLLSLFCLLSFIESALCKLHLGILFLVHLSWFVIFQKKKTSGYFICLCSHHCYLSKVA